MIPAHIPALAALALTALGAVDFCDRRETVSAHHLTFSIKGDPAAAAPILEARLEALGMSPGPAQVRPGNVSFTVARGLKGAEVDALMSRGHVRFRPVREVLGPGGRVPGSPEGTCTDKEYRKRLARAYTVASADAKPSVACAVEGGAKYVLEPADRRARVRVAAAVTQPDGSGTDQWSVMLSMADKAGWAALTEGSVGKQLAIVLDGVVQSAPFINERIPSGEAVITGLFDEDEAKALVAVINAGELPEGVSIEP